MNDELDPVERLRYFCSTVMTGEDWVASEKFFNSLVNYIDARGAMAIAVEREQLCKMIKAEDDYCIRQGDYMLDSEDCIQIIKGSWQRPEFVQ